MKILNIHGFDGDRLNTNFSILRELGHDVTSIQIDYRKFTLDQIYKQVSPIIIFNDIELIVANSFGAFIGKRLSNEFNINCIFTNPCFRPDISLKNIAPEYFNAENESNINSWLEDSKNYDYSRDVIIYGDNDEVIDHSQITLKEAQGATFYKIQSGSHHLEKIQYEKTLKFLFM